jgi:hypothetical protein
MATKAVYPPKADTPKTKKILVKTNNEIFFLNSLY